jgi:pyrimidine deaminase RibD-like protein
MFKVATIKANFFFHSEQEALEQAAILQHKWNTQTFVVELAPCSACGGEREDDLTQECNGCLMEMAAFYENN